MSFRDLIDLVVRGVGWAVLLAASVFCLACGLYNAAEWLEDHVRTSFRIIKCAMLWSLGIQLTWIMLDQSAWLPNLVGIASHASSWLLLKHHPHHMDENHMLLAITAVLLLAAHQASWIYWWFSYHGVGWAVTSVLASLVWPVPTMLLLSSASSDSLPVSIGQPASTTFSMPSPARCPTVATAYHRHRALTPDTAISRHHNRDQQTNGGGLTSMFNPWSTHDGQQQQQQGKQRHRSRVLQGFVWLQRVARRHQLLPVTEGDTPAGASPAKALVSKLYQD